MVKTFVKIPVLLSLIHLGAVQAIHAAFPEVPQEAKEELGSTSGRPVMSGFVFINGRYLPPPYTVARVGNGIFINRLQVQQPVPWSRFQPQAEEDKAVDSDGDFESVEETPPADKPVKRERKGDSAGNADALDDLFEDVEADSQKDTPSDAQETPRKKKDRDSSAPSVPDDADDALDDLFGDSAVSPGVPPAPASSADVAQEAEGNPGVKASDAEESDAFDDLFDAQEKATPSGKKEEPGEEESEDQEALAAAKIKRGKERLKIRLDRMRAKIEKGLANNEIYFFSYTRPLVNGNYGTARTLIGVLPDSLRVANSWYHLKQLLERGGVYFLDTRMIQALFRNKATYPQLILRKRSSSCG